MKQQVKIEVPTKWSAVTLKKYLGLRTDLEAYKDDEEAVIACLFHHLCNFPANYIGKLDLDTYINIKKDITNFFNDTNLPLQKFIMIDGVEFGFEPNLSSMSYGAYVDISGYETLQIDEKWAEIMSILYRPVINKTGKLYEIQSYTGKIDGKPFMELGMDVHFGTLFFFKTLLLDLQKDIQKSLMASMEVPPNIKSILERNGSLIRDLSNLHKTI